MFDLEARVLKAEKRVRRSFANRSSAPGQLEACEAAPGLSGGGDVTVAPSFFEVRRRLPAVGDVDVAAIFELRPDLFDGDADGAYRRQFRLVGTQRVGDVRYSGWITVSWRRRTPRRRRDRRRSPPCLRAGPRRSRSSGSRAGDPRRRSPSTARV